MLKNKGYKKIGVRVGISVAVVVFVFVVGFNTSSSYRLNNQTQVAAAAVTGSDNEIITLILYLQELIKIYQSMLLELSGNDVDSTQDETSADNPNSVVTPSEDTAAPSVEITSPSEDVTSSGEEVVIADAIAELKPTSQTKDLLMIQSYTNNEACMLSYTNRNTSIRDLSANEVRPAFNKSGTWLVAEWYRMNNFCDSGVFENVSNQLIAKVPDEINPANNQKVISFLPDRIRMSLRSVDIYKEIFGGTSFFTDKSIEGNSELMTWPQHFLTKKFDFTKINDYSEINFNLVTTLRSLSVKTSDTPGTPPKGAQNSYSTNKHATQFRLVIPLQWRGQGCAGIRTGDCQYHGDYVHLVFLLHDERFTRFERSGISFVDEATGQWMYSIDLRKVIPNGANLTTNPFAIEGKTAELDFDAKELLSDIIFELEEKGKAEGQPDKYLPPRLVVNGQTETDQEYLSHFGFSSFNIGYEVPGLSAVVYDIEDLKIVGKK